MSAPMSATIGRPTSLTPEVQAKFVDAILKGHYIEHAAPLSGITARTAHSWMERGAEGEEPYASFLLAYKEAEASAVARAMADIENAQGGKDAKPWTNRAWWLERRHPRLFGRTVQEVEHTGQVNAVVKVELPQIAEMQQQPSIEVDVEQKRRRLLGRGE